MIVLDASVLIAHLNRDDACHSKAERLLIEAEEHPISVSSITLAEVLVVPARVGRLDETRSALAKLQLSEVSVPAGAAEQLARLRAETGLRLPDCCVLLTADITNADAVFTFDERLAKRVRELGYEWESPSTTDGS